MKSSKLVYITATVSVALVIAFVAIDRDLIPPSDQPVIETTAATVESDMEKETTLPEPAAEVESIVSLEGEELPQEIIRSIYDYDLDFQQTAQAAAERVIEPFNPDSFSRWRPVRLETASFLTGSYLEDGSIKKTFQISPFPETIFTVVEKSYKIYGVQEQVTWEGSIVGTDNGTVHLAIVGGVDNPGFMFKIRNGPQIISVSPTDTSSAYVAIEANPHFVFGMD
jgi:hypothetical protein